jgi:8-oxo-dGTP diphosphatase
MFNKLVMFLEMYESWEECAKREVKEECDLDLDLVCFGYVTNDPMKSESKHYVTIFMLGSYESKEKRPANMEPHKCNGWKSYSWKELEELQSESKLFGPLDRLVKEKPKKVMDFLGGRK